MCYECKKEWKLRDFNEDILKDNYKTLSVNAAASDKNSIKLIIYRNHENKNYSRSKICTVVKINHFGPIPCIPVGTMWEKRLQVSEAGVHRPLVAGIHGREKEGAFSIVVSGSYPDDIDNGDELVYTGCGGAEYTFNKRICPQVKDQEFTRMNKALALNCAAKLNEVDGAKAENWRDGKPIRVIRSYKLRKTSIYAPEKGFRYDGLYKLVQYFPDIGHSGFIVWKYILRRDDPTPAPWTKEGEMLINKLNLKLNTYTGNVNMYKVTKKNKILPKKIVTCKKMKTAITKKIKKTKNMCKAKKITGCGRTNRRNFGSMKYDKTCPKFKNLLDFEVNNTKIAITKEIQQSKNICNASTVSSIEYDEMYPKFNNPLNFEVNTKSEPVNADQNQFKSSIKLEVKSETNFFNNLINLNNDYSCYDYHCNDEELLTNNQNEKLFVNDDDKENVTEEKNFGFQLNQEIQNLIECDNLNSSNWDFCRSKMKKGQQAFLDTVRFWFTCPLCQNLVTEPVTTVCEHNICLSCLKYRFKHKQYICPDCSVNLDPSCTTNVNKWLQKILNVLFF